MLKWIDLFNVSVVGADYGVGHKEVVRIKKEIGSDRVFECMYTPNASSDVVYHPEQQYFSVLRNHAMEMIIDDINGGNIEFPRYDGHMSEYAGDLTAIYQVNDMVMRRTRYDHSDPDDFMHTLVYSKLAAMYYYQQLEYGMASV